MRKIIKTKDLPINAKKYVGSYFKEDSNQTIGVYSLIENDGVITYWKKGKDIYISECENWEIVKFREQLIYAEVYPNNK